VAPSEYGGLLSERGEAGIEMSRPAKGSVCEPGRDPRRRRNQNCPGDREILRSHGTTEEVPEELLG
jgi:hypothetical protein